MTQELRRLKLWLFASVNQTKSYSEIFVSVTGVIVLLVHDLLDHVLLVLAVRIAQSLEQLGTRTLPQTLPLAYQQQLSRITHKTSN